MKNITLYPMLNYHAKKSGAVLSILSMILLIVQKTTHFILLNSLTSKQHYQMIFLLIIVGLFLMVFSKEKVDDERIQMIRNKAFQIGFGTILTIMISFNFVSIVSNAVSTDGVYDIQLIALISLFIYLFIFNSGLYFDSKLLYNNEDSLSNFRKNKLFFIAYIAFSIVFAIFLLIL